MVSIYHTVLCSIKVNSNTIELTVHTSRYSLYAYSLLFSLQAKISIVSRDSCLAVYDPISKNFISEKQICAGTEKVDSCSGDSGGPMLSNQFGQYAVVGITSFGVKCKDPTFPGNVLVSSNVQSNCELELSLVLVL